MVTSSATTTAQRNGRRTQEERSAATRQQLLDATIDVLVELGYSATTTTVIAERAGVSRGAQLHHFPTKAELVAAAVEHLASKLIAKFSDDLARTPTTERMTYVVDALQSSFSAPLLSAWVELSMAARTDAELRATMAPVTTRVQAQILHRVQDTFGRELGASHTLILAMTVCLFEGMTVEAASRGLDRAGAVEFHSSMVETWKTMLRSTFPEA